MKPDAPPKDAYWAAALEALAALPPAQGPLLGSGGLAPWLPALLPLEFSWAMSGQPLLFCCSKDDIHRLAPWVLAPGRTRYLWANEVFVVGQVDGAAGTDEGGGVAPQGADPGHMASWLELARTRALGAATRAWTPPVWHIQHVAQHPQAEAGLKVLVLGASGMGNVGDDLLADALRQALARCEQAEVVFADPDLDPSHCAAFDLIVAGPGGIVYASRPGRREYENLANYLKFAFIAERHGCAFWLVGVGDQQLLPMEREAAEAQQFLRQALARTAWVSVRDRASARFFRQWGALEVTLAQDLVFAHLPTAQAVPRPVRTGARRVALCGEWFEHGFLREVSRLLASSAGTGLQGACEFQILLFSNDDQPHAQRLQRLLVGAGHSATVQDARSLSLERLCYLFKGFDLLLTSRFHAAVLAALCGTPFVAADRRRGKIDRLCRELGLPANACMLNGIPAASAARELLDALLADRGAGHLANAQAVLKASRQAQRQAVLIARKVLDMQKRKSLFGWRRDRRPSLVEMKSGVPHVRLCWAAGSAHTQGFANLGDSLSAVVVSALAGLPVSHTHFDAPGDKLVAVGSIAHAIKGGRAVLWGPGVSIRGGVLADNVKHTEYDVRAIRGEISASHLRGFGIEVPACYGDPVWLLPSIFHEELPRQYELGVIPHINDIDGFRPDSPPKPDSLRYRVPDEWADRVKIINTWHEPTWDGLLAKLRQILSCRRIVSQSFHGVVLGEAYRIPVMNYRQLPQRGAGVCWMETAEECRTDPRIFEFFKAAGVASFPTWSQRRDQPSDWGAIIEAVDAHWKPIDHDMAPLVQAFPLPLAFDPRNQRLEDFSILARTRF